ncbi:TonB-dependent receptor [Acetobacter vaccinii]|nr:TonB-dependent receptor [Acetobacter vaccinii]
MDLNVCPGKALAPKSDKNFLITSIVLLAATTMLTSLTSGTAVAQTVMTSPKVAPVQEHGSINFNIPAGSLSSVLTAFSIQAHTPLGSQAPMLAGKSSSGLQGRFTSSDALSRLLQGSGLTYRVTTDHAFQIIPVSNTIMLGPVRVGGILRSSVPPTAMIGNLPPTLPGGEIARGGQLGMLGNKDVMDTPFSTTSYTAEFIQNRQIRNIRDALKDDPSIRGTWATGSAGNEQVMIRGFSIPTSGISFGGLYGMLSTSSVLTELAERVEVLRGPGALMNGMSPDGNIGGTINIVPKRAHDKALTRVEADYTSNLQFGGQADVGRRFGKEKQLGVRLNGMIRSGPTAIARSDLKTALVGAGVDLRLRHVRLSTDFGYQYREIDGVLPYLALGAGVPVPDAAKVPQNLGASWGYNRTEDIFGVFRAEVDIFRNVTAYGSVGVHDSTFEGIYPASVTLTNQNGTASTSKPLAIADHDRNITADVGVRGKVETGPVTQNIVVSANRYNLVRDEAWGFSASGYPVNIYKRSYIPRSDISVPGNLPLYSSSTLSSLAFADTISALDKRIQVTAGLRVQRVQSANFSATTGLKTSSYDKTALSPAVMAVFKPLKNVSIYGNWIQGLQQGSVVGTTYANAGEIFAPYKSTQYELGVKADFKKIILTFDVFQISQPSTVYDVVTNIMSLNGEQRNRGLELNIAGEIVHGLHATGGLMLIDPVLKKTQGGLYNGQRAPNVSPINFNMGLDYSIPFVKGLSVNTDIIYTSSQYIENPSPRRSVPGWVRLDMGARYVMPNPATDAGKITLFLNVDNVTNARYWNAGGYNNLTLGAPRTFRFAVAADF